jgi:hypothetical protein
VVSLVAADVLPLLFSLSPLTPSAPSAHSNTPDSCPALSIHPHLHLLAEGLSLFHSILVSVLALDRDPCCRHCLEVIKQHRVGVRGGGGGGGGEVEENTLEGLGLRCSVLND